MDIEEIETFVYIYEYRSLSKVAELLYISQSTASSRINSLENKLGFKLLNRSKGIRYVSITDKGLAFLPIAQQILYLWEKAKEIKQSTNKQELIVSSSYINNTYLLLDFYKYFSTNYSNINIKIKTYHSNEIHKKIDNFLSDIGLVSNIYPEFTSLVNYPLFIEEMGFVVHKNHLFSQNKDISALDQSKEIYLPYNKQFDLWHSTTFNKPIQPFVTVSTALMQMEYLLNQYNWCIAPDSIEAHIPEDFIFLKIDAHNIPKRYTYLIYNENTSDDKKDLIQFFINTLIDYFNHNNHLKAKQITIR